MPEISAYDPLQAGQAEAFVYDKPEIDYQAIATARSIGQSIAKGYNENEARKEKERSDQIQNLLDYDETYVEKYTEPSRAMGVDAVKFKMGMNSGKIPLTDENISKYNSLLDNAVINNNILRKNADDIKLFDTELKGSKNKFINTDQMNIDKNILFENSYNEAKGGVYRPIAEELKIIRDSQYHENFMPYASAKDWVDKAKSIEVDKIRVYNNAAGTNKSNYSASGKFFKLDSNGEVAINPDTGRPEVNMEALAKELDSFKEVPGHSEYLEWRTEQLWEEQKDLPEKDRKSRNEIEMGIVKDLVSPAVSATESKSLVITKPSSSGDKGNEEQDELNKMSLWAETIAKLGSGKKVTWNEATSKDSNWGEEYGKANKGVDIDQMKNLSREGMVEIETQLNNADLKLNGEKSFFNRGVLHLYGTKTLDRNKPFDIEIDLTKPKSKEELFNLIQYSITKSKKIRPTSGTSEDVYPDNYGEPLDTSTANKSLSDALNADSKPTLTNALTKSGVKHSIETNIWRSPQSITFNRSEGGEELTFHVDGSDGYKKLSEKEKKKNMEIHNILLEEMTLSSQPKEEVKKEKVGNNKSKTNVEIVTDPNDFF